MMQPACGQWTRSLTARIKAMYLCIWRYLSDLRTIEMAAASGYASPRWFFEMHYHAAPDAMLAHVELWLMQEIDSYAIDQELVLEYRVAW
jgi:hypothetical protein